MKRIAITAGAVACVALLATLAPVQREAQAQEGEKDKLAKQAAAILQRACSECHGQSKLAPPYDVGDFKTLLIKNKKGKQYISQSGKEAGLKESNAWTRISDDSMPQDGPLPDADKAILKKWIEAGAPEAKVAAPVREYVGAQTVLRAIYKDLKDADEEDRPYMRYFTFDTLHNNPKVSDEDLRRSKAGFSKVLNSMHWRKPIVIPRALKGETKKDDPQHTVFAVDLRDLDWDRKGDETQDRWSVILKYYPYGIRYDDVKDDALAKLDRELFGDGQKKRNKGLAGGVMAYVRADWFMAMATRSPVYEGVLRLPATVGELEHQLGVDSAKDFKRNRVVRAGFTQSGVSKQHRLIERHDAKYGAYWKSFDFLPDNDGGNLVEKPLGPIFAKEYGGKYPYLDVAFKQDGGEMIFNLPNGLQAYYLAKADDKFLDVGPIKVVEDKLQISGGYEIVNALSCMNCHIKGMIETPDQIRNATSVRGEARRKVRKIYLDKDAMQKYYDTDAELFQTAARKSMAPFLKPDEVEALFDRKTDPLGKVAKFYSDDMTLDTVACELGYAKEDVKKLEALIEASEDLAELNLQVLVNKGQIKRADWGSLRGSSLMQKTMFKLNRGYAKNAR